MLASECLSVSCFMLNNVISHSLGGGIDTLPFDGTDGISYTSFAIASPHLEVLAERFYTPIHFIL